MLHMNEDSKKLNQLFRTLTARKISLLSRLAGLNEEEINIMRLRWLDNKPDAQICDELGMSPSTLIRKREVGKAKIIDAMDLYGLSDFDSLEVADILDYNGLFYKAQDELIRFFIVHKGDEQSLEAMLGMLKVMNGR